MLTSLLARRVRPVFVAGIVTVVVAGQLALTTVAAHAAAFYTVSQTADVSTSTGACGNSTITTAPSPLSLREATCLANNNNAASVTINVPAGTYHLTNGELQVGRVAGSNITITGAGPGGTIVDAGGLSRVFELDPNLVGGVTNNFSGLTISGGTVTTFGGAGIIAGSGPAATADTLVISNTTITNNTVNSTLTSKPGGGVQFEGGSLTISNSTISNNTSGSSPGSGVHYIAEGFAGGEQLTVTGSTFSGNSVNATAANVNAGGALSLGASGAVTDTVTNDQFVNNTVVGSGTGSAVGAGILAQGGTVNVTGSTFTGNSVTGGTSPSGGAIAVLGGTVGVHYSRLVGNVGATASGAYLTVGGSLNATDDWWGCNTGPGTAGCDTVSGGPTVSPRLVLTATASPATIVGPNATTTITAALTTDSLGSAVSGAQLGAFAGLPVAWSGPLPTGATVGSGSSNLVSGSTTTSYNSHSASGPGHVLATLDNGTATATITVNLAPTITSANSTSFTVGSAGSFTVTTGGYPAAAISKTGTAPTGMTFVDNGNGTATVSGTPTAAGTYTLNLTANNGVSPNATQTLTLQVNQAPSFTSAATATFTTGTAGSFSVTTTGLPTAALSEVGALPSGVTFTDNGDGTATIAGTPVAGSGGTYPLSLTANNGVSPNGTQSLSVQVNQAPAITTNPGDHFVAPGASVSFIAAASGVPTPTVQWQRSTDGGTNFTDIAGASSTTYTFTAAGSDNGNLYRAVFTNVAGTATSTAATLTVGLAPTITSADHATFTVGSAGSFSITTTGFPSATLSRTGAQFPAWLTLTDNGDGTGSLTGTPPGGSSGTYTFTLKAANGNVPSASQTFTLTVTDSPVITSANHATFTAGTPSSFTVTTTAGFPASTTITKVGSLPSGVTFTDNGDGTATLAGTPSGGTVGSYPISISATNGATTPATQSFTLTVLESPVITSADHATFTVGSAGSFTVTTISATALTVTHTGALPSGVSFTDNGDGTATLAGTPAAGTGGVYTISIVASDGVTPNANQTFTLTVNQPPAITSADHAAFSLGVADSFTVTTTPGQPASTTLTETGALPSGVTFTDNGDGTATIAGTPGAAGSFPITLSASNGVLPDASQSFTLTVNQAPVITSADHTTFRVGTAGSFAVTTSPAAVTLTETGALPTGVTFTDNGDGTATIAGTPAAGTGGTYPVTIRATNPTGFTDQAFTLTVNQPPAIASANHASFDLGVADSFTVTTTPGQPASTTLTETGALPSGVTFTDNGDGTATIAGTPGAAGSFPITLSASNGVLPDASQSFTLTVNQAPVITSADHTTFRVGTAGSFVVTTSPAAVTLTETGPLPSGVTFTDNGDGTATIAGTPAAGTGGTYPLTIRATNLTGFNDQAFTLTVNEPPAITSVDHAGFGISIAGSFTVTTSAGHPAATTITETGALPTGVTFTDNGDGTATIAGTPAAGTAGSYTLTVKASNGVLPDATQAFTLTVGALAQAITVTSMPPAPASVGATYTVAAVSDSGLAVAVTVEPASAAVCSVTGSAVSLLAPGQCTLDFDQAGNSTYAPAAQVQQVFTVAKVVTSLLLTPSLATSVFGQPVTVSAAVASAAGTPAGSVQFSVDGVALGTPVAVAALHATSPALTAADSHALAPGSHTVTAVFTPTDGGTYATASGTTQTVVTKAATTASVSVQRTTITAAVSAVAPGAGTPSGSVTFSINGRSVGDATLVAGVATLSYRVPPGQTQRVSVAYPGDTDFTGSSASTARHDPHIVATVTAAKPMSKYGWYRTPVTVTFSCTASDAPLVDVCPAPVQLSHSGAAQSVTRTVDSSDGGAATVVVNVNLDLTKPIVHVGGVHNGAVYTGSVPVAKCVASDKLSGVARCALTLHKHGDRTDYRVTATDKAGNVASASGHYRVLPITLLSAPFVKGAFEVRSGHAYTLVVYATARPVYFDAAPLPLQPTQLDKPMLPGGHGRWVLRITMRPPMHKGLWYLGVKIGKTLRLVLVRVV